jgi:hypothetical protein
MADKTSTFVPVMIPEDRVLDVYAFLTRPQVVSKPAFEDPPESDRKKPQCAAETVRGGFILRCLKGPRHGGRHE